ncbi:MAG: hypothetical protein Unbinned2514contig1000_32 [Prokaryotic dsDNA virus sp.]|nr:MAG: hypothetical protein Unbinned2514contig1000_32 [Prokaryotic dsDNA virus sp.]
MPIYDYKCEACDGRFEEIFLSGDSVEESLPCQFCDSSAHKVKIYSFDVGGLEDHQLQALEATHFTPKQRAAAFKLRQSDNPVLRERGNQFRFRTNKDLERYEASKGWRRLDPNGFEHRRNCEKLLDDQHELKNIAKTEGDDAAAEHITKTEIQTKTGWSSLRYSKWKSLTEKASNIKPTEVPNG